MAFRQFQSLVPTMFQSKSSVSQPAAKAKAFGGSTRTALGDIGNQAPAAASKSKISGRASIRDQAPKEQAQTKRPSVSDVDATEKKAEVLDRPDNVADIDAADMGNPQLVAEYVTECYTYMKHLERRQCIGKDYMSSQATKGQINASMRRILIDWLVDVHIRFKLVQETMQMAVHIIDRFLQVVPIARKKLQLVGITALLIASKYEDMWPPRVADCVFIADNAYSGADVLAMEQLMLRSLDYNLGCPLGLHFLRRYSKASGTEPKVHTLAKYIMELKMYEYGMVHVYPSVTAAASLLIARKVLMGVTDWDATLEHYSGYTAAELKDTVKSLQQMMHSAQDSKEQAVRRKFAASKYWRVSSLPELAEFCTGRQSAV